MHGERMEITEKARVLGKRERFGRLVRMDRVPAAVSTSMLPFRTYARMPQGNLPMNTARSSRTSWGWLGRHYGRSRQLHHDAT